MQFLLKYNGVFHRTRANIPKLYIEPLKNFNSNNDLKKEQSWRNHANYYQTILQVNRNQNSMVLA